MLNLNEVNEREYCLSFSIQALAKVNRQLEKLSEKREELTKNIIGAIGHNHEGQKTYEYESYKLEIKTPFIYSLDKSKYESGEFNIPRKFDPIKKTTSYSIDKKLCDKYLQEAPEDVREALIEIIDKKPGKAAVHIREK